MSGWALTVTRSPEEGHDWEWRLDGEIALYGWDAGSREDARRHAHADRKAYLERQAKRTEAAKALIAGTERAVAEAVAKILHCGEVIEYGTATRADGRVTGEIGGVSYYDLASCRYHTADVDACRLLLEQIARGEATPYRAWSRETAGRGCMTRAAAEAWLEGKPITEVARLEVAS